MKKKIVGIFVCMLLITSIAIPVIGIRNDQKNNQISIDVDKKQGENSYLSFSKEDYEIIRDDYGVPHVYSNTKEGLAYGMGYAIAEDRLWQLDLMRRECTGRLAEYDYADVEYDLFIRTISQSKKEVTSIYNNISSPCKEMFASFVEGVNQYIDEALADPDNKMPAEYIERGLSPEYLTVEDSLATALMSIRLWGEACAGEELFHLIDLFNLIKQNGFLNGWKIFNDLFPINDPDAATTLDGNSSDTPKDISLFPPLYPLAVIKLAEKVIEKIVSFHKTSDSLGLIYNFGSNAWVVSPEKSASGNTFLLGGPQMGYSIPQILVEVGLHGADVDVVGVTLPGVGPLFAIGVSKWGAWSQTVGNSDLVDTYIERLHPLNKMKYKFNGNWHDMDIRTEIFYDSSGVAHEYEIYRTIHGPVLGSFWFPIIGGFAITRKEPDFNQAYKTMAAYSNLPECKNVSEYITQLKEIPTSMNFLFADRYGNIGYLHSGWYPIRPEKKVFGRRLDRRFPLMGTGKEEWQGILPLEENPQGINPSKGFFANWNNKPHPDWIYSEGHVYSHRAGWGDRVRRIQELLTNDNSLNLEDMKNICKNVAYHEPVATDFIPFLREAIHNIGGVPPEVAAAVEDWDCYCYDIDLDGCYDDPGYTIFWEWFFEMYNQSLMDEIPKDIHLPSWKDISLYHRILNSENASLELRYKKYLNGSRDEMIINALDDALITLENKFGTSNISEWLDPVLPLTENIPIFNELGSLKSPEKLGYNLPYMDRGTYNQIAEMPSWKWSSASAPPIGINVLPCGQSGFVKYPDIISPHAYDQLDLYLNWEFKPMLYNLSYS